jgi:hypothetical protein
MSYRIAGIDVHKKMLAVVVSDVEVDSEFQFERRWFGSNPEQLRSLAAWLVEQQAEEVVTVDHCRSRPHCRNLSLREMSLLVGGWVPAPAKESAGVNYSHRSPKGNRHMRRLLNQAANAAARTKGSIFEIVYRRSVPRLGHNQAIGAIAHRQCRLIWLILHHGVRYEERGPAVTKQSRQRRTSKMIRHLRTLGYRIEPPSPQPSQAQVK